MKNQNQKTNLNFKNEFYELAEDAKRATDFSYIELHKSLETNFREKITKKNSWELSQNTYANKKRITTKKITRNYLFNEMATIREKRNDKKRKRLSINSTIITNPPLKSRCFAPQEAVTNKQQPSARHTFFIHSSENTTNNTSHKDIKLIILRANHFHTILSTAKDINEINEINALRTILNNLGIKFALLKSLSEMNIKNAIKENICAKIQISKKKNTLVIYKNATQHTQNICNSHLCTGKQITRNNASLIELFKKIIKDLINNERRFSGSLANFHRIKARAERYLNRDHLNQTNSSQLNI